MLEIWFVPELDGFVVAQEYVFARLDAFFLLQDSFSQTRVRSCVAPSMVSSRIGRFCDCRIWFVPELDGFVVAQQYVFSRLDAFFLLQDSFSQTRVRSCVAPSMVSSRIGRFCDCRIWFVPELDGFVVAQQYVFSRLDAFFLLQDSFSQTRVRSCVASIMVCSRIGRFCD